MLQKLILVGTLGVAVGCGSTPVEQSVAPIPSLPRQFTPINRMREPIFTDQARLLAPDEQKAVSVAKAAVQQRYRLAGYRETNNEHLAFYIEQADTGWRVQVSTFNRDVPSGQPVFTCGGFVEVTIDKDWNVTGLMGGA